VKKKSPSPEKKPEKPELDCSRGHVSNILQESSLNNKQFHAINDVHSPTNVSDDRKKQPKVLYVLYNQKMKKIPLK